MPRIGPVALCWSISLLTSLLLAACTSGRDFTRPSPNAFVLGKTTKQETLARYGEPQDAKNATVNAQPIEIILYGFSGHTMFNQNSTSDHGITPMRVLTLGFVNDVLTMYCFISTFEVDRTDFDETKIEQITEGEDSCAKVVSIFGAPHGYAVEPMMSQAGEQSLLYTVITEKSATRETASKTLEVICDKNDVVEKMTYMAMPVFH